jgi:hypothetical protein
MVEIDLNATDRFQDNFALGPGLEIGIIKTLSERWKIAVDLRGISYELGDVHRRYQGLIAQNFAVGRDMALSFQVSLERSFGLNRAEIKFSFDHYF